MDRPDTPEEPQARVVLCYGAAAAAERAAAGPGRYVLAVEGDRARAVDLQSRFDRMGLPGSVIVWPAGEGAPHRYPLAIWSEPFFRHPDLIVIAGPMGGACLAAAALRITRPVTVLFEGWDRHPDRPRVERIATPLRVDAGTATFQLEPHPPAAWLQDLFADLCGSAARPEQGPLSGQIPRAPAEGDEAPPAPPVRRLDARAAPEGFASLFRDGWEGRALRFFEANRARASLLATPDFAAGLRLGEETLRRQRGRGFDFALRMLGPEVMAELRLRNAQGDRQLFVVADPEDEGARLAQLGRTFPALRFCGLGRDLWPALTARADAAVFGDIPATLALRTITLVFATPRSGSSLLADLLTDIGAGKVLEHLRDDTVAVLTSGYVFDRRAALRNFLNLAATKGSFGTKFISHFLHDALTRTDLLADLAEVTAGVELRVLLLDRRDKVAQALSGYVAWQRGLWHVTNPAEADRLRALPAPALRFPEALAWYLDYLQQSRFVDLFRPVFPQAMALVYEDDLLGQDLAALAQRLAAFLGLPPPHGPFRKAAARLRLADGGTALMAEDFTRQFRQTFAAPP